MDEAGRSHPKNGRLTRQPFFIVGVLLTNNPDALLAVVKNVRDRNHFSHELHWSKQGSLRERVYCEVVEAISEVEDWEYRAARFRVDTIDFALFPNNERLAYNDFISLGIEVALRCGRIDIRSALDITVDAKYRFKEEGLQNSLRQKRGDLVEVRELDSKAHDLLQVCDVLSGAHNSIMVPQHCGERKLRIAEQIWLPSHCQAEEVKPQPTQEMEMAPTRSPAEREVRSHPQYTATLKKSPGASFEPHGEAAKGKRARGQEEAI